MLVLFYDNMKTLVNITITATLRPALLDRTLQSFCSNLFRESKKYRFRLVVNVDPIGENVDPGEVVFVCRKHIKDVVYRVADKPDFPGAVIWCWSQVEKGFVFHLEDDWVLKRPVNLSHMINCLRKCSSFGSLRLSKADVSLKARYYRRVVDVPSVVLYTENKTSLNPTLFDGGFIQNLVPLMDPNRNPEKQLRVSKLPRGKYLSKWKCGIYLGAGTESLVVDIGRRWIRRTSYGKNPGFVRWEKGT